MADYFDKDKVREDITCSDVLDWAEDNFNMDFKRTPANRGLTKLLCPNRAHNDRHLGSCMLYEEDDKIHCFACGFHGGPEKVLKEIITPEMAAQFLGEKEDTLTNDGEYLKFGHVIRLMAKATGHEEDYVQSDRARRFSKRKQVSKKGKDTRLSLSDEEMKLLGLFSGSRSLRRVSVKNAVNYCITLEEAEAYCESHKHCSYEHDRKEGYVIYESCIMHDFLGDEKESDEIIRWLVTEKCREMSGKIDRTFKSVFSDTFGIKTTKNSLVLLALNIIEPTELMDGLLECLYEVAVILKKTTIKNSNA